MKQKTEIVVIGGGVIGAAIAYYLAKKGKKVIVVEKKDHACGATGACDQQIILQSKNPGIHLELALKSAEMYSTLAEELECQLDYVQTGGLILVETQEEMQAMQGFVERQKKIGLQVEILDRQEALKKQKGLAEHLLGAVYSPQDAHIDPFYLNYGYANAAKKLGAQVLLDTEVTGIKVRGDRVEGVETTKGTILAPIVINAAGAWAPQICQLLEIDTPIKPRRGQIVITEPVPDYVNCSILSARYIAAKYNPEILTSNDKSVQLGIGLSLTQTEKGNILIGATREFVGYDLGNTREGIKEVLKNATRVLPELKNLNMIRVMAGLRPYTPDGLPVIGFVENIEGFFMATGHEGDGIALAPITGRIVSDLISEGKTFIDAEALSPGRF